MKDLGARSVTAVFWGGGGAISRIFLQFISQVFLARILGPDQYGLFAIGAIVVSFSNFFADVGIAYGLIQKKEVAKHDLRFITTWQFIIGALVSATIALASGKIAAFFGDPRAAEIIKALAIICFFNAMTSPSHNMLKRGLDFKRIQIAQLISYFVGFFIFGIPLAIADWQAWSLVIAWLVQSIVALVVMYWFIRHPLKPLFWYTNAVPTARYGLTVLSTNLTNWLINNVDRVVVGRIFTSKDIGAYATSYNLIYNPTSSLLGILQPVFFSASSRLVDEKSRIAKGYLALIGCIALFIFPAFVGLAVVSKTFALAVYGAAWTSLGTTLQPLALAMPLFLLWGLTTPLLWTGGDASREFRSQLPLALLWIVAAWAAAQISLTAVAWAVFGLFLCRFTIILRAAILLLDLRLLSIWYAMRGGIALTGLCALNLLVADYALNKITTPAIFRLIMEMGLGLTTMLLALRLIPSLVGADIVPIIEKISTKLPSIVAPYFRAVATSAKKA